MGFGNFGGDDFGDLGGAFDLDKIKNGIKEAFFKAAQKQTPSQALFQNLNAKFSAAMDADQSDLFSIFMTAKNLNSAFSQVARAAKTDASASQTFAELQQDIQAAVENGVDMDKLGDLGGAFGDLGGGIPGFGKKDGKGGGFFPKKPGSDDKKDPNKKPPQGPKKDGGDGYQL